MIPAMVEETAPIGLVDEGVSLPPTVSVPTVSVPRAVPLSVISHLRYLLLSMRPKQWTKSGIVFLALIFSVNQYWVPEHPSTWVHLVLRSVLTAVAFSLASGADYLVNDVR